MQKQNDPRFVCLAGHEIEHSGHLGMPWVRGFRAIRPGERVLVVFATEGPRLYPLDGEAKKPVLFRVSPALAFEGKHPLRVFFDDGGLLVYTTVGARQEALMYQLSRVRPDNAGDLIEVLIALDHLIFHLALDGKLDPERAEKDYALICKCKALALGNTTPGESLTALQTAVKLALKLVDIDNRAVV